MIVFQAWFFSVAHCLGLLIGLGFTTNILIDQIAWGYYDDITLTDWVIIHQYCIIGGET
jgi:Na+/H+ antiporter NhaA